MSENLEIEFKTLLSMPEYERLLRLFSHVKPIRQTNFYFDTPELSLREQRLALRIRCFKNAAEMTLKVPQDIGNMEHNIALALDEAERLIAQNAITDCCEDITEITDILNEANLDVSAIGCIGSLTTTRRECHTSIGLEALDANEYLGTSDYEFELEVDEESRGHLDFEAFLKKNDIEFRYARSKVVRFLDTLRHRKK
ncbi:MAG: CYTH domain-containing protein [Streptococcaceae bacterium]|jgi:uncharacterized protein YjbK|nr:CYTH domain-containing protein [Streptococcaceae bacterium]